MGFELPNGKTARNLQDQVKFLSEKLKDLYAAFNESGLKKIEIVDELPEVGDPTVLYLLARQDPEQDDYYEEYLWYDNAWEKIGTTHIDLSDYCTLSTNQIITGTKTFGPNGFKMFTESGQDYPNQYLALKPDQQGWIFSLDSNDTLMISIDGQGSGIQVGGMLFGPLSNNATDLGANSNKWKDIYLGGKIQLGQTYIEFDDSYFSVKRESDGANVFFANASEAYCRAFKPISNNTYDIGANGAAWKDLYLSGTLRLNGIPFYKGGSVVYAGATLAPDNNTSDLGTSTFPYRDLYLSGDATAKTFAQTNANWEGNLTPDSIPTGATLTSRYVGAKIINNVMHLVLSFTVENTTASAISTNQFRFYTEDVPVAYRGKIYDIEGHTLNDTGGGVIRIGTACRANINGGNVQSKFCACQRYAYQLFFDFWDYDSLAAGETKAYYAEMQLTLL